MEHGEKLYYKPSEAAKILDVEMSTLNYWIKEFDIKLEVRSSGRKLYTPAQLEQLKRLQYLLKVKKFTIEGAKEQLKQIRVKETDEKAELVRRLKTIREKLQTMRDALNY